MLQTLERQRKYIGAILSDEHALWHNKLAEVLEHNIFTDLEAIKTWIIFLKAY